MVAQQVLVLFVQVRILVVQRAKAPMFPANVGAFVFQHVMLSGGNGHKVTGKHALG